MTSASPTILVLPEDGESAAQHRVAKRRSVANSHPVLNHARKAAVLQGDWAMRAMRSANETFEAFALGIEAGHWGEILEMQHAAWRRLFALQSGWMREWDNWLLYADQIRGANTMSKFAERQGNIVAQFVQLFNAQASDLVGLQENIEVDYSYWVNEKLSEKRKALAAGKQVGQA